MAKMTRAVTTAVRTISRPVARCSSGDMPLVLSRNGTSAIFGPSPISRSSRSLPTSSVSMLLKSMILPSPLAVWWQDVVGALDDQHGPW